MVIEDRMIEGPEAVLAALTDEAMIVPPAPAADEPPSLAWFRARVVRFSEGPDHERRRRLVEEVLAGLDPQRLRAAAFEAASRSTVDDVETVARTVPVQVLAGALDLTVDVADVAAVGKLYLLGPAPGESTVDADAAVVRLIKAVGAQDERAVAVISILVQSCEATARLIMGATKSSVDEALRNGTAVRTTRRMSTVDGIISMVDIASAGLPFGAGRHACPGSDQALAIATGVVDALSKI